jgi:hypothetical protein
MAAVRAAATHEWSLRTLGEFYLCSMYGDPKETWGSFAVEADIRKRKLSEKNPSIAQSQ